MAVVLPYIVNLICLSYYPIWLTLHEERTNSITYSSLLTKNSPCYFQCPLARHIFPPSDDPQLVSPFQQIEPEWYCPVIPTVLVNRAEGIDTGYSSCHFSNFCLWPDWDLLTYILYMPFDLQTTSKPAIATAFEARPQEIIRVHFFWINVSGLIGILTNW